MIQSQKQNINGVSLVHKNKYYIDQENALEMKKKIKWGKVGSDLERPVFKKLEMVSGFLSVSVVYFIQLERITLRDGESNNSCYV